MFSTNLSTMSHSMFLVILFFTAFNWIQISNISCFFSSSVSVALPVFSLPLLSYNLLRKHMSVKFNINVELFVFISSFFI